MERQLAVRANWQRAASGVARDVEIMAVRGPAVGLKIVQSLPSPAACPDLEKPPSLPPRPDHRQHRRTLHAHLDRTPTHAPTHTQSPAN